MYKDGGVCSYQVCQARWHKDHGAAALPWQQDWLTCRGTRTPARRGMPPNRVHAWPWGMINQRGGGGSREWWTQEQRAIKRVWVSYILRPQGWLRKMSRGIKAEWWLGKQRDDGSLDDLDQCNSCNGSFCPAATWTFAKTWRLAYLVPVGYF